MKFDRITGGAPDYCLYRFANSKIRFRGPRPNLSRPYIVFLGSSETFGKYIEKPFVDQLAERLDIVCANFSALNAGLEMYLREPSVLAICASARATVVGVCDAHNMSNRFYSVHPRRNDRFLRASALLKTLFRDVDLSDIHFTRHLLETLAASGPERFEVVLDELRAAWTARMRMLLGMIEGRKVLFWMARHAPADRLEMRRALDLSQSPLFVDRAMMAEVSGEADQVVECIAPDHDLGDDTEGMLFPSGEAAIAAALPGPRFHFRAADMLEPALRRYL